MAPLRAERREAETRDCLWPDQRDTACPAAPGEGAQPAPCSGVDVCGAVRVSPKSQVVRAGQARPAAASTEPRRQRSVAGKLQFAKPAATKPREPAAMAPF